MKSLVQQQITHALQAMVASGSVAAEDLPAAADIAVERSRGGEHGDFACPVAMSLARVLKRNPRQIAQQIAEHLPASDAIDKVEVAGPGFLNFFIASTAISEIIGQVLAAGDAFGHVDIGHGEKVQVEFVSANPTGPLHVAHGRGAPYGAALANLLSAAGFNVQREYYINDAGRQMDILAVSTWLRYLQHHGQQCPFPAKGYQGDYVRDMAVSISDRVGAEYVFEQGLVFDDLPEDPDGVDKASEAGRESYIDALIARAKSLLGVERYAAIFAHVRDLQVADIRTDLADFGVNFDCWFSEHSLKDSGAVDASIERLKPSNHIYDEGGTLWFRSTEFGDEKDRVVVRDNGAATYFASDIAYVDEKFSRGFERIIYVWGADHHGYIPRLKAATEALGRAPERVEILLVQFAQLFSGGQKMQMSTRSGEYVTLRELREEVGRDAARFFYVMRRSEQHLDFDLDLAKSKQKDNPVYYVQYAHARIASNFRRAEELGLTVDQASGLAALDRLTEEGELALMGALGRFPELVRNAAVAREPHQIAFYVRDLANLFHGYYATPGVKLLDDDDQLRNARLVLCTAVAQVIRNALALLDVSAPESM
jgi:arginyl-tRNA synthetase